MRTFCCQLSLDRVQGPQVLAHDRRVARFEQPQDFVATQQLLSLGLDPVVRAGRPDDDLPIDLGRRRLQQRGIVCREFVHGQFFGPAPRRRQARRLAGPDSQSFACREQTRRQASGQ